MRTDEPISALMKKHKEELRFHPPAPRARVRPPLLFAGAAALATAACITICLLSFQLGRVSQADDTLANEVVSSHVRSLMASHLSDVISTDQHTVKPWFEGKLDFGPVVKDFAAQNFALTGGRLDYIGERAVAALVYKHGKHFVNVFEWPAPGGDSAPKLRSQRGFQIFSWQKNGLVFWLVSDVNAADLQEFAGMLAAGG
jgi:anti-sigma factor RsiW